MLFWGAEESVRRALGCRELVDYLSPEALEDFAELERVVGRRMDHLFSPGDIPVTREEALVLGASPRKVKDMWSLMDALAGDAENLGDDDMTLDRLEDKWFRRAAEFLWDYLRDEYVPALKEFRELASQYRGVDPLDVPYPGYASLEEFFRDVDERYECKASEPLREAWERFCREREAEE